MGKEQNIRVAYVKPEIKTAHVLMGSMILEVSFPGDHNPGVTRQDLRKSQVKRPRVHFPFMIKTEP